MTRAGTPPIDRARRSATIPRCAETLGGLARRARAAGAILLSLGFTIGAIDDPTRSRRAVRDDRGAGRSPSRRWRRDVDGPADLVEEVIRIEGIDNVPSVPLPRAARRRAADRDPEQKLERSVRRTAAARGLDEAVTWSFISGREAAAFGGGAWTLANPISEDLKVMRPSLLPGLLAAAARNAKRGAAASGCSRSAAAIWPTASARRWAWCWPATRARAAGATARRRASTPIDAKAEALALLEAAGAPVDESAGDGRGGRRLASRPVGHAAAGAEDRARRVRHAPPARRSRRSTSTATSPRSSCTSTRCRRSARTGFMRPAYTPPALQAVTRDFAFLVPAGLAAGDAGPRGQGRGQGGDRRRAPVRPCSSTDGETSRWRSR